MRHLYGAGALVITATTTIRSTHAASLLAMEVCSYIFETGHTFGQPEKLQDTPEVNMSVFLGSSSGLWWARNGGTKQQWETPKPCRNSSNRTGTSNTGSDIILYGFYVGIPRWFFFPSRCMYLVRAMP